MKIVGYVRVSTREQADEGNGLAAQRTKITQWARERSDEVIWIEDAGHSGKDVNRPGLLAALAMLQAHDADGLVVSKLDRLSRSTLDFTTMLDTARRQGWSITALDLQLDSSTPAGKMLVTVLMSFAEFERDLISLRTREGLAEVKARGVRLGSPVLIPAHVEQRIVRERDEGHSLARIANGLDRDGVPCAGRRAGAHWHPSTVAAVCRRAARGAA